MQAVALAARQRADFALLGAALEVEPGHIGARCDGALADLDLLLAAGDFLPDTLVGIERIARLIDIADLHGLSKLERAAVGLLLPGNQPERCRLAGAVGADDADDASG